MEFSLILVYSIIGGILPDILRIISNKNDPTVPPYLKSPIFYIGLFLLICVGLLANILLKPTDVLEAISYAFGAPEILSKLISRPGETKSIIRAEGGLNLRNWWAF